MKYLIRSTCILATSLLLTGCLPDEPQDYLWWSPNGETAAIRTPDGLRLAGTNGQLSAVVLPAEIQSAAWMPDSSSLLVSRSFTVTNWTAIESLVPSQETAVARQLAAALPDMLKGGLTVTGERPKTWTRNSSSRSGWPTTRSWTPPGSVRSICIASKSKP